MITDPQAPYFGLHLDARALLPGENPRIGTVDFVDWLSQSTGTLANGRPSQPEGVSA